MKVRASMAVIGAALLWTSAGWAGDLAPSGWPPLALAEARLLIGGAALALWVGPRGVWLGLRTLPTRSLAPAVLAMAGFQWGFFAAVSGAGSGAALLLVTSVGPFAADLLDRDTGPRHLNVAWQMALVVLCAGALKLGAASLARALAVLAGVGSGIAYAFYARTAARLNQAASGRSGGLVTTTIALLGAGVLLAPITVQSEWPSPTARSWAVLAYLGLVATSLAYSLFAQGLRALAPSQALSLLVIQPVAALVAELAVHPDGKAGLSLVAALPVIAALLLRSAALHLPVHHRRRAGTAPSDGSCPQCH